jgi:catechol-2,3-dioxygenase
MCQSAGFDAHGKVKYIYNILFVEEFTVKVKAQGVSEVVLEVNDMKRAVDFWSGKLGCPNEVDFKIIEKGRNNRVYFKDTEENIIEFYTVSMEDDYLWRLNQGIIK